MLQQNMFLLKGSYLPKPELKKRLMSMGVHLDPIDDHKTTFMHMYDYLIRDENYQKKIIKLLNQDQRDYELDLLSKKRLRSPWKGDSVRKVNNTIFQSEKRDRKTPTKMIYASFGRQNDTLNSKSKGKNKVP
jgi:hypothetical protein